MRIQAVSVRGLLLTILLGVIPALPLAGANNRDFAGTYSVSDASQSGDTWTLTFSAKVFNYSGADVSNATLRLVDPLLPNTVYATFTGISIPDRESAVVSSSVTIPAREYQSWQQGAPPRLTIEFTDASGAQRLETVELVQGVAQ
jgi:hypothetical protein